MTYGWRRGTGWILAGVLVASLGVTPSAVAVEGDSVRADITTMRPDVKFFSDFSYSTVTLSGDTPGLVVLQRKVSSFVDSMVNELLKPSKKTRKYLKRVQPASYEQKARVSSDCRRGYFCLSQGSSFVHPQIAGSITDLAARAWHTSSGRRAKLQEFVSPSDLSAFTARVKSAIKRQDCFYGFAIDLPASYESYPNWVPVDGGIELWFPEYQFGCQYMNFTVPWQ